MTHIDATDLAACFITIINALEKHGMPRELIVEAAQERLLTLEEAGHEDLVLLRALATLNPSQGRD